MREQPFEKLGRFTLKRSRILLVVAACVTVASLATLPFLRVDTSRTNLVSATNHWQVEYTKFLNEFGSAPPLVILLEGASKQHLRAVAERLGDELSKVKHVRYVFTRVDPVALGLLVFSQRPHHERQYVSSALAQARSIVDSLSRGGGLVGVLTAIADEAERASKPPMPADAPPRGPPLPAGAGDGAPKVRKETIVEGLTTLAEIFFRLRDLLLVPQDDDRTSQLRPVGVRGFDEGGFIASGDGKRLVVLVEPTSPDDSVEYLAPFVRGVRGAIKDLLRQYAASHEGVIVKAGTTGIPATVIDELDAISSDTFVTTFLSFIFVALLIYLACRSVRITAVMLTPLVIGIAWSVGFVVVTVGHFNLLTSTFMATALGLGIDYGIHMYTNYVEEFRENPNGAVARAVGRVGPGVVTTGLATIASFLCLLVVDLRAFVELGYIAAVGLAFIVTATLFLLPPLLDRTKIVPTETRPLRRNCSWRLWGRTERSGCSNGASRLPPRWPKLLEGTLSRAPRLILILAGLATIILLPGALRLKFDYNLAELLPRSAESIQTQVRLARGTDFAAEFVVASASTLDEAKQIEADWRALPPVGRVDSLTALLTPTLLTSMSGARSATRDDFLAQAAHAIDAAAPHLSEAVALAKRLPAELPPPARIEVDSIEAVFSRIGRALTIGRVILVGSAVKATNQALASLRLLRDTFSTLTPIEAVRRLNQVQEAAWSLAAMFLKRWKALIDGPSDGAATLGGRVVRDLSFRTVIDRFVGRSGKLAVYAYPKESIWESESLERFLEATRQVAPAVTGFPVTFYGISRGIQRSILVAGSLSLLLVVLLVWLDFRRVGDTLLALFPIFMGGVWMLGLMKVADLSFNLANIVGIPLVLGMGVESGIYIIHRRRQLGSLSLQRIFSGTGRGVIYSAVTTIAAFGSLALASHRGVASMGFLLLTGISACLVTSLVVLPALLKWLDARK